MMEYKGYVAAVEFDESSRRWRKARHGERPGFACERPATWPGRFMVARGASSASAAAPIMQSSIQIATAACGSLAMPRIRHDPVDFSTGSCLN